MAKIQLSQNLVLKKVQYLIYEMKDVKKTFKPLDERQAKIIRGRVMSKYMLDNGKSRGKPTDYNLHMSVCELYIMGYSTGVPSFQKGHVKRIISNNGYFENIPRCRLSRTELGNEVKRYNTAFKIEVAEYYLKGNTISDTIRKFNISYDAIRDWVQKYELGKFNLNEATGFSLR